MIRIRDKALCCGCGACSQICPKHCIVLSQDEEGFLYPSVNEKTCVDCGLCEKVCPVINQRTIHNKPQQAYAAVNKTESIRMASSSGGVFRAIADVVMRDKGVVFGAKFDDNWSVIHDCTETSDGLAAFQGSKYVQSEIRDCYQRAKIFLDQGRKVLFSGTPCQIAGLNLFLRKSYSNLVTVDLICHGVPSPQVWDEYLEEEIARQCNRKNSVLPRPIHEKDVLVEGIAFRDKSEGWKKYSFALALSTTKGSGEKIQFCSRMPLNKNIYLRGFLSNLYLRPSCYNCPAKSSKSGADITLADFWNVHRVVENFDDNKGTSLVIVNSQKGKSLIDSTSLRTKEVDFDLAIKYNSAYYKSIAVPNDRVLFFTSWYEERSVIKVLERMLYVSPSKRFYQIIKRTIRKLASFVK